MKGNKHIHYYGQLSLNPQYMVCACGAVKPRSEVDQHDLCDYCFAAPKRAGRYTCSEECAQALLMAKIAAKAQPQPEEEYFVDTRTEEEQREGARQALAQCAAYRERMESKK